MNISIISKSENLIRDLVNEIVAKIDNKPFIVEINKKLKFSNPNDWKALCSLMDIIGDTELAKENFIKYGLGGPTKFNDIGEQYLRLYGITNAVYLQKSAIIALIDLVKLPNKKKELLKINECKIIELRNIVGAHTIDYFDNGTKNPHQITRAYLNSGKIQTSDSKNNFKNYDLKKLVIEFNEIIEDILIRSVEKFIKTVLKNGGEKKAKYLKKIETLKTVQNGGMVFWSDDQDILFTIKVYD